MTAPRASRITHHAPPGERVPLGVVRDGRLAFTLIEMMLAITIFAVVIAAVNGVFFGVLKLRQKTADAAAKAQPLELALTVLRRDLACLVMPGGQFSGPLDSAATIQGINEQNVGTEIFTTSGVFRDPQPWADIQRVAYVLRAPTNRVSGRGLDLVRVVKRNLLPLTEEVPEEQHLMQGVSRIDFTFYDGSSWRTSWNSTNEVTTLPRAIKVEITVEPEEDSTRNRPASTFRPEPVQLIVPVMVATLTNSTSSTTTGETEAAP